MYNNRKRVQSLVLFARNLLGDQEKAVLRKKGTTSINTWAEKKGHSLPVIAGTLLHTECIRKYAKPKTIDIPPKADSAKRLIGSSTGGFYFRLNCFFRAQFVTNREKQTGKVHMVQCKNKKIDRATADAILM